MRVEAFGRRCRSCLLRLLEADTCAFGCVRACDLTSFARVAGVDSVGIGRQQVQPDRPGLRAEGQQRVARAELERRAVDGIADSTSRCGELHTRKPPHEPALLYSCPAPGHKEEHCYSQATLLTRPYGMHGGPCCEPRRRARAASHVGIPRGYFRCRVCNTRSTAHSCPPRVAGYSSVHTFHVPDTYS